MVAAIDKELEARAMGINLTAAEQLEVFGTDKAGGEWADEAERRWGGTDAYRESQARAARYGKDDWVRIKAEADGTSRLRRRAARGRRLAAPTRRTSPSGTASTSAGTSTTAATRCTGAWRTCTSPTRFTATYDGVEPGLARYVHDAILANAGPPRGRLSAVRRGGRPREGGQRSG